jgi:hypothetical protein
MRRRVAAAFGAAAVLAGGALAAATPVSPGPGAMVSSSHPVFSWTLPANEQAQALYVADSPDLAPDGKFDEANIVASGALASDQRQWTPSNPLYAGHYWWLVWSSDRGTSASFYSTPTDFKIPISLTLFPVRTVRSTFLHLLAVRIRWTANVHRLTVRARVLKGKKIVWQRTEPEVNAIGFSYSTSFAWYRPPRIKQGTRLRLEVTLRAQGVRVTRALVVRAP